MNNMIGTKFKLLRGMLGNPAGTIGYVFNQYIDFDDPDKLGVQIIFPNGEYDGFSYAEQQNFLENCGLDVRYVGYQFRNVMQVSNDFRNKYWNFD